MKTEERNGRMEARRDSSEESIDGLKTSICAAKTVSFLFSRNGIFVIMWIPVLLPALFMGFDFTNPFILLSLVFSHLVGYLIATGRRGGPIDKDHQFFKDLIDELRIMLKEKEEEERNKQQD